MKRFLAVYLLWVMLFSAFPAFGDMKEDLPSIIEGVVQNRDFFARPWVLKGYEDCFLYEVNRLDGEQIGVVLITPIGFEVRAVYDVNTLDIVYLDTLVPEKSKREEMRRESVSVADAIKLAKRAENF